MGASTWIYFTPYQSKPSAALTRLRKEIFAAGQYRQPPTVRERIAEARGLPSAAELHRQTAASMRAEAARARRDPATFDTPGLREQMVALFLEMRRPLPPGSPVEQLIAYYDAQAERAEQMATFAEAAQPKISRFLEAVEANSAAGLPADEVRDFRLFQQLRYTSPTLSRKFAATDALPKTIEELLERAGEEGTHSILDITKVARRAAPGVAFALRPDLLMSTFGTTEPTRAQVETSELSFAEALTWQAVYFVVYQEGAAVEWAFVGSSGD